MSQESVEITRQALDAFNRGDRDAWLALCDPELENIAAREWPESGSIRGREAVWTFLVQSLDAWTEDRSAFEFVELIDAGNDRVIADLVSDLRGKASGASVAFRFWQLYTFRDAKLVRVEWFVDRAEALEAAGLRE